MKNGLMMITAFLLQLVLAVECRAQSTAADNYPTQTIKIITNVGVGDTYDILARALADELQKTLGKPVVVEPRPGGLLIAGRACAEAAADGHTVCTLLAETMVYSGACCQQLPSIRARIWRRSELIFNTQLLSVSATLGVESRTCACAPSDVRSPYVSGHRTAQLSRAIRPPPRHRYRQRAVQGGRRCHRQYAERHHADNLSGWRNFVPYIADGAVVGLAVDGRQRSPLVPDVPTIYELGQHRRCRATGSVCSYRPQRRAASSSASMARLPPS